MTLPVAVSMTSGWFDVFAIGTDGLLWHRMYREGEWKLWHNHGGNDLLDLRFGLSLASWGPNRLHMFGIGKDHALYWTPTGWHAGWQRLGGYWTSRPGAVSWERGRLDVFLKGANDALYHTWYDGGQWHHWGASLDGYYMESAPALASWGPDRLDVAYVVRREFADDPAPMATNWYDGDSLDATGWHHAILGERRDWLGAAIACWAPGRIDIIALARNNNDLYRTWYDGQWHAWENLGGAVVNEFASGPSVATRGPRRLDLFIANSNGQLNWKTFNETAIPCGHQAERRTRAAADKPPRPSEDAHTDPAV